ncbi:MAG: flagellar hook-length control protein FliK [Gallionella sp.]|nr:flagellar hook-length control protein FliK [Gallionella sp.]
MLPANVISALQILSNTGRPPVALTAETPKPVTNLEPGQQLQGSVQEKLSEGLFKVQVAGQTLQMRLPGNIKAGDTIKLEVLSLQPRITFGIVASTNPLSTPEQIGSTARMLSNLAERPIERPIVQQSGNKAVWETGQQMPDTKVLAGALRETLGKSGLFYESHQAQWIRGERSINQLREEPQNLLTGKGAQLPDGQYVAPGKNAAAQAQANVAGALKPATEQAATEKTAMQPNQATQAKPGGDAAQPIAKELVHMVQQQLHTLEQHHLVWMGQVWPGQQMQWEIRGQPEHQARQQDERQWSTEMELTLPSLGGVHARLVFAESGLRVMLRATEPATAHLFHSALPRLKNSLADAGIPLVTAVVEKP